ncbi:MAG: hypothetical protein IPM32_06205 [Ignavibacteriae bacterium]|nr:hypothetical protein [Ignavibacteriota bacterium]
MGGKAALLLILGFSTIMLMFGLNMNRVSTNAVDNSSNYFENEMAKEISRSGINLAASNLSRNHSWQPSDNYDYLGEDNLKITVNESGGIKTVTAVGSYKGISKLIEVKISLASFSEYAYFSNIEGDIWWTATDSVWGPFHTNDKIQVQGHPYFNGPITSHGGAIKYYTDKATDEPTIQGTYLPGTTINIPTDGITNLSQSAASSGYVFSGHSQVFLQFDGDSIKYKYNSGDPYVTVLGTDLAPNGVIYVENGNLRIEGTVKGNWSVGSNQNVYLDNDVVYNDVPDYKDKNDASNDLLGIVSKNDVIITDNAANSSNINVHAAIYCETGGFTAENYKTRSLSGTIHLIGGITQYERKGVGTFIADKTKKIPKSGFPVKDYKYDNRLLKKVPPYFPSTNTFKILSWLE